MDADEDVAERALRAAIKRGLVETCECVRGPKSHHALKAYRVSKDGADLFEKRR